MKEMVTVISGGVFDLLVLLLLVGHELVLLDEVALLFVAKVIL